MKEHYLWVEKYRPTSLKDYVFKDERTRHLINTWIKDKDIPHIMLYGPAGTGKSSLINVIIHELEIYDKLYLNCSEATSIDDVRDKIVNYASTISFEKFKIIILEEMEMMSPNGQAALKRVMEDCSMSSRFIITTNNVTRILPPIRSRCTEIYLNRLDEEEFLRRSAEILLEEKIDVDSEALDGYFRSCYPDLRKMINTLQQNTRDGKLLPPTGEEKTTSDVFSKSVELFKKGSLLEARKYICENLRPDEYVDFYQFLYRNLDLFGSEQFKQDRALIVISDGLKNHSIVADPEINLAATLVKLTGE